MKSSLAFLLLMLLCGCSTFNREWKQAIAQPASGESPTGPFEGEWRSEANGHHGRLRCIMTPGSNSVYLAKFRANFGQALHYTYTARFEMQPHAGGWEFNGEANLGKLFGSYYYEGRATATNLVSLYRSKNDHGKFELRRPSLHGP